MCVCEVCVCVRCVCEVCVCVCVEGAGGKSMNCALCMFK